MNELADCKGKYSEIVSPIPISKDLETPTLNLDSISLNKDKERGRTATYINRVPPTSQYEHKKFSSIVTPKSVMKITFSNIYIYI